MKSLYLLAVVAAVAFSSVESAPSSQILSTITVDELEERLRRGGLLGGLLGGGEGGGGGLLGGLLGGGKDGGGLLGGLLGGGEGGGGLLGGILDPVLGIVGGILDPVLGIVTGLLDTLLKLISSLVSGLAGAKTKEEQTSVFDKYALQDLCPVCDRLPNPEQVNACQDYCKSKNYRPTRHLLLL